MTTGELVQKLVDMKHGGMETIGVKVVKQRGSLSDTKVFITTLWVGNDYLHSGYLQAHSRKSTFECAIMRGIEFTHESTKDKVKGTVLTVLHIVKENS